MSRAEMQTSAKGKAVKDALVNGGEHLVWRVPSYGGASCTALLTAEHP